MRRIAPALPVPPAILRHFAVLTVVITAGLAMFANGDSQSSIAEQIKQRQMKTEALRAERDKATRHTVVVDGLRIAPGTKLAPADIEPPGGMVTNVVALGPQAMADFPELSSDPGGPMPAQGVPGRTANGGPTPPPAMMMQLRGKPGERQAKPGEADPEKHRPLSEQELRAMIEASARRAGKASVE